MDREYALDVVPDVAAASASRAVGEGVSSVVAGRVARFNVTVRDMFGNIAVGSSVSVIAALSGMASVVPRADYSVDGGRVQFEYECTLSGMYSLSVTLGNGVDGGIAGSPFSVSVLAGGASAGEALCLCQAVFGWADAGMEGEGCRCVWEPGDGLCGVGMCSSAWCNNDVNVSGRAGRRGADGAVTPFTAVVTVSGTYGVHVSLVEYGDGGSLGKAVSGLRLRFCCCCSCGCDCVRRGGRWRQSISSWG